MIINKKLNILIYLLFIGMWLSIGANPENFLNIFFEINNSKKNIFKLNLNEFINFIRAIYSPFCLLICSFIIVNFKLFKNQEKYLQILFLIQILQLVTTFLSKNTFVSDHEDPTDHIGRYYWLISSSSLILIFMIANKLHNFKMKNLFYISTFFLTLIVLFFSYKILLDFFNPIINRNNVAIYNLNVWRESGYFLSHEIPRVTGISRSICILIIFIMFINLKNYKFQKYVKYFLIIVLGTLILLYQSKFALIFYLIICLFYFFSFKRKIRGFINILMIVLLQILLFISISNLKFYIINKNINNEISSIEKIQEKKFLRSINTHKSNFNFINDIIMSGRVKLWTDALSQIKHRPLLGYGSMSDRIIINKKKLSSEDIINPVSNAFIYSLVSGGVFCLVLLMIFLVSIRAKLLNIIYFNELHNGREKIGSLILLMILLRMFIENSFMLFGVDLILLLNSLSLVKKK